MPYSAQRRVPMKVRMGSCHAAAMSSAFLALRIHLVRAGSRLVQTLLPPVCQICADPGQDDSELCGACRLMLPWHHEACVLCAAPLPEDAVEVCFHCEEAPPALQACWASLRYEPPISGLLVRHKFHQDLAAGRLLSQLMLVSPPPWALAPLVPIPLHPSRLRKRGYNQAKELARLLQAPLWEGLKRERATAPQSERNAQERRNNLDDAFSVQGNVPEAVVLIDDVMTTGSTLHAAAEALAKAGCADIRAWVCARVPPPGGRAGPCPATMNPSSG